MTPADLAELLKTTAAAVLADHDLDVSALPETVAVERPVSWATSLKASVAFFPASMCFRTAS